MAGKKKKTDIPKYYRISQEIIAGIQAGDFATGQKVPSENEIIERYKVSNTTARKTLKQIEEAGWVRRIKGKGTIVCQNSVNRSINRILSFTKNMLEVGKTPSTKLISAKIRRSRHFCVVHGRQYTLESPFCEIQRLRFADGVPVMKETRYISTSFCPGIEKMDLEGSLYEIYRQEYGLDLERVSQILSAVMLDNKTMEIFGLRNPTPAFCVEGVTFCGKELIVEMEESVYRGDMYHFSVEAM